MKPKTITHETTKFIIANPKADNILQQLKNLLLESKYFEEIHEFLLQNEDEDLKKFELLISTLKIEKQLIDVQQPILSSFIKNMYFKEFDTLIKHFVTTSKNLLGKIDATQDAKQTFIYNVNKIINVLVGWDVKLTNIHESLFQLILETIKSNNKPRTLEFSLKKIQEMELKINERCKLSKDLARQWVALKSTIGSSNISFEKTYNFYQEFLDQINCGKKMLSCDFFLFGPSGGGKTSIINLFDLIAQEKKISEITKVRVKPNESYFEGCFDSKNSCRFHYFAISCNEVVYDLKVCDTPGWDGLITSDAENTINLFLKNEIMENSRNQKIIFLVLDEKWNEIVLQAFLISFRSWLPTCYQKNVYIIWTNCIKNAMASATNFVEKCLGFPVPSSHVLFFDNFFFVYKFIKKEDHQLKHNLQENLNEIKDKWIDAFSTLKDLQEGSVSENLFILQGLKIIFENALLNLQTEKQIWKENIFYRTNFIKLIEEEIIKLNSSFDYLSYLSSQKKGLQRASPTSEALNKIEKLVFCYNAYRANVLAEPRNQTNVGKKEKKKISTNQKKKN